MPSPLSFRRRDAGAAALHAFADCRRFTRFFFFDAPRRDAAPPRQQRAALLLIFSDAARAARAARHADALMFTLRATRHTRASAPRYAPPRRAMLRHRLPRYY